MEEIFIRIMKHHAALMAAESILNRDFGADRPLQKMGSDIIYIPTDEEGSVWRHESARRQGCRRAGGQAYEKRTDYICP